MKLRQKLRLKTNLTSHISIVLFDAKVAMKLRQKLRLKKNNRLLKLLSLRAQK